MSRRRRATTARGAQLAGGVLATALFLPALAIAGPGRSPATAGPRSAHPRIIAPAAWGLITTRRVRLVVHVPSGATLKAWIDSREIGRAFRSSGSTTRVASVASGAPGMHILYVRVRNRGGRVAWTSKGFVTGRRSPGLVTLATPGPARPGGARLSVGLRAQTRWERVSLNGRSVLGSLKPVGPGARRAGPIAVDDGLRFGSNSLTVVAYGTDGRYAIVHRSIYVSRSQPLIGAPDLRTKGRHWLRPRVEVRLPRGVVGPLTYRWRLISRPRSSAAKIEAGRSRRPELLPDRPGYYRLMVSVSGHVGDRHGRLVTGSDVATAEDDSDIPPLGTYLNTREMTPEGPVIRFGPPAPSSTSCPTKDQTWEPLQLLIIDRATGQFQSCTVAPATSSGWSTIEQAVNNQPASGSLLGVFSMPATVQAGLSNDDFGDFQTLQQWLGGPGTVPPSPLSYENLQQGTGFSMIGISGAPQGAATLNISGRPSRAWQTLLGHPAQTFEPGAITGWVEYNGYQNGQYSYVPSDYVTYSTSSARTATSNELTVGDMTPFSVSLPPGSAGFQVVPLDAYSLQPEGVVGGGLWLTNNQPGESDQQAQANLAGYLASITRNTRRATVVMIQSVGTPRATTPTWDAIAQQIQALGGTRTIFDCLNLTSTPACQGAAGTTYALVGGVGLSATDEGNPTQRDQRLSGVLTRDNTMRFDAAASDPLGKMADSPLPITYQPPVRWPASTQVGGVDKACEQQVGSWQGYWQQVKNADQYITVKVLGLTSWGKDIRRAYWNDLSQVPDWESQYGSVLSAATYPSGSDFASCVFSDLQAELLAEFTMLDDVGNWMTGSSGLIEPYTTQNLPGLQSYLTATAHTVELAANPSNNSAKIVNQVFTIAGDVATIAAALIASDSTTASSAPTANPWEKGTGVAGGLLTLGADLADVISADIPVSSRIQVEATQLETQLNDLVAGVPNNVNELEEIVFSDYGKLSAFELKRKHDPNWSTNTKYFSTVENGLTLATARNFYAALLPLGFSLENASTCTGSNAFAEVNGFTGQGSSIAPTTQCVQLNKGGTGLTNPLFAPVAFGADGPTGLGMNKAQFYTQTFSRQ